jgi:hypothetical protein
MDEDIAVIRHSFCRNCWLRRGDEHADDRRCLLAPTYFEAFEAEQLRSSPKLFQALAGRVTQADRDRYDRETHAARRG